MLDLLQYDVRCTCFNYHFLYYIAQRIDLDLTFAFLMRFDSCYVFETDAQFLVRIPKESWFSGAFLHCIFIEFILLLLQK